MTVIEKVKNKAYELVRGSAHRTESGIDIFTPDGVASYDALWLRDFSYMVEYAGEAFDNDEIEACIRFAIAHRREDGWMPDRVYADGITCYAAGTLADPVGEANLDNTPFLIYTANELFNRARKTDAEKLFTEWYPHLKKGMEIIPLSDRGLVWNDPTKPHSPYGFTDTVAKTGELFMESLLYWRAAKMLSGMCGQFKQSDEWFWNKKADAVERSITEALFDNENGVYLAATIDCRQIDVWANAYMLYIGFPAQETEYAVRKWLSSNVDKYTFKGQIRHLPKGEYWEKTLINVDRETYQNGAYWGTATGWLAWAVSTADYSKGMELISEAIAFLMNEGSYECINEEYEKLPSFVVSATNIYGGLKRIINENSDAEMIIEQSVIEKTVR